MAGRTGPVLAALITLGALAGAVVAERTADFPKPPAAVAPSGVDAFGCPTAGAPLPGSSDPTGLADVMVPIGAVSVSVCRYDGGTVPAASVLLDGLPTAQLARQLDTLVPVVSLNLPGPSRPPVYVLTFHYGQRAEVVVELRGVLTNGSRGALLTTELYRYLQTLTGGRVVSLFHS